MSENVTPSDSHRNQDHSSVRSIPNVVYRYKDPLQIETPSSAPQNSRDGQKSSAHLMANNSAYSAARQQHQPGISCQDEIQHGNLYHGHTAQNTFNQVVTASPLRQLVPQNAYQASVHRPQISPNAQNQFNLPNGHQSQVPSNASRPLISAIPLRQLLAQNAYPASAPLNAHRSQLLPNAHNPQMSPNVHHHQFVPQNSLPLLVPQNIYHALVPPNGHHPQSSPNAHHQPNIRHRLAAPSHRDFVGLMSHNQLVPSSVHHQLLSPNANSHSQFIRQNAGGGQLSPQSTYRQLAPQNTYGQLVAPNPYLPLMVNGGPSINFLDHTFYAVPMGLGQTVQYVPFADTFTSNQFDNVQQVNNEVENPTIIISDEEAVGTDSSSEPELVIDEDRLEPISSGKDNPTESKIDDNNPDPVADKNEPDTREADTSEADTSEADPKIYKCSVCNRIFGGLAHLSQHKNIAHSGNSLHQCFVCSKRFVTEEKRDKHFEKHSKVKPFPCEGCYKGFHNLHDLQQHEQQHRQLFYCSICGKGFARLTHRDAHEISH